ncbi:MAG: hypothetical protein ABI183_18835, partial [Polyangiaceae bacterium]
MTLGENGMSDADTEVREHALRQARKRGIVALAVTAVLVIVALAFFRASIDSPPGIVACTT